MSNVWKILAYRMTTVYDDQGDFLGDSIAEIMWFDSMEDFTEFCQQPSRKYQHWSIVETWKHAE